jgi:hypothetical protein
VRKTEKKGRGGGVRNGKIHIIDFHCGSQTYIEGWLKDMCFISGL